jgi:hypothetical protein
MLTWNQYKALPDETRSGQLHIELKKYFTKYIPEEYLSICSLSPGEVPCFSRYYKKIYFVDKKSTTSSNSKTGFIRLTILHMGHTPRFVKEKVLKIITENNLKKYQVFILYRGLYLAACVLHGKMSEQINYGGNSLVGQSI